MRSRPLLHGMEVEICGWVSKIRDLGNLRFILVRDTKGILQVTLARKLVDAKLFDLTNELTIESTIKVKGVVKTNTLAKATGGVEIIPSFIEVVSIADTPLPLDTSGKIESCLDNSLNWRCISLRQQDSYNIFKIESALVQGFQEYLRDNEYQEVFTPCLIGAVSESGAETFEVKYFDRSAFLRQDPQLHRELTIAAGFEKIFEIGPSFRADPSHTPRHLCEFRSCAVETSWIGNELDTMHLESELIIHALKFVKNKCEKEIKELGVDICIPKTPFPELRFPEIYTILEERGKKIVRGEDYDRESEKILSQYVKEQYDTDFFFVNRFPAKAKPFYVMKVDNTQWARSVDLIYKGMEMSSGGQREHRYQQLIENLKERGMRTDTMEWFTKFFRFGVPPLGGFAIGIERLTMQLLNIENVREVTLFPRDTGRLFP
jgi:nondiscriminating aspartyl-tRNA synthetase